MITFYLQQNKNILSVQLRSDQGVNAWQGEILLPKDSNAQLNTSGGITSFWQDLPHVQGNLITFAGGRINGWSGQGELFQIILPSARTGQKVIIQNAAVYLNDGQGTQVRIPQSSFLLQNAATSTLFSDNIPPEPFKPQVYRSSKLFNSQPVVLFETQDKQSGIARYEIKEITTAGAGDWHTALSPYLINPDVRRLEIKAVDNYGNERVENLRIWPQYLWLYITLAVLAALLAGWMLYNKRKVR